jgi:hypothetical protein
MCLDFSVRCTQRFQGSGAFAELQRLVLYNPLESASMKMRSAFLRASMVESGPTILLSTEDPLDLHALMQSLVTPETAVMCVVTGAIGLRDDARAAVFSGHSEDEMRGIADEIRSRWSAVAGVGIVQRLGILESGMPVLMVACSSTKPHEELWEAAQFGMDRLGPGLRVDRGMVGSGRSEQEADNGEDG